MCVGQQRKLKNKLWAPKGLILAKNKAAKSIRCTNFATSLHLQKLWLRESFWSIESNRYKDRDKKKTEYGKIFTLLKDEVPGLKVIDNSCDCVAFFCVSLY